MLLEHEWPGNVREMANVMEHSFIISGGHAYFPNICRIICGLAPRDRL